MEVIKLDEQKANKLDYRITQLENKIKRAEILCKEIQLDIFSVCGVLQNTKVDFEHLRRMIYQ